MGKYDDAMYRYLTDNDRFVELFNVALFHGENILRSDMLEAEDGRYVSLKAEAQDVRSKNCFRDLKKRMKNGNWLAITAIENQEAIDYTMPWRMMQYDSLEYEEQLRRMQNEKRAVLEGEGIKPNAWNTRFAPADKLNPVFSLCFYHGTDEWRGPTCLRDMMNFEGASAEWVELFQDYGMTLFCVNKVTDWSVFKTGLKHLLQVIPFRKNKKALRELWQKEEYKHLDRDTAETIAIMTDATDILEHLEEYGTKEGYDMCQAMEELRQDWLSEGIEQGIEQSIRNLMETMKLTVEQAMDALKISSEERATYLSRIK